MREGRFMLQHCAGCGKVRHYPRPVCPHCFSMESSFKEAPTGGAIHTWTVCHHPFNFFFKAAAPYIVALVDMDAGVRVNAPLRGIAETDLKIGQRVQPGLRTGDQRGDLAVLRRRVSFREEKQNELFDVLAAALSAVLLPFAALAQPTGRTGRSPWSCPIRRAA